MSMPSFRDALNKAAAHHNPAAARAQAPAAAPSFLADLAERVEQSPDLVVNEQVTIAPPTARVLPFQPSSEPIAPATTTGFGSMLQRIAGQSGAKVVSVLGEAAPAAPVQAPVATPAATVDVQENLLGGLLHKIANPIGDKEVGEGILSKHHSSAHDHLDKAMNSIAAAHADVSRAHELATDDVHKARLKHQMGHLSTMYQGLGHAKEAGNIANHEYMKSTGKI